MLQKAVDIHFDLNYKHLCTSPNQINDDDDEDESPFKPEKKEEVMEPSSLAEEKELDAN